MAQAKSRIVGFDQYQSFLRDIGYLEPEVEDFQITTDNVDDEVARQCGPQLVVPVDNPRYALNATMRVGAVCTMLCTARMRSMKITEQSEAHRTIRCAAKRRSAFAEQFLDKAFPLAGNSHRNATGYAVKDGRLIVKTADGEAELADGSQLVGYNGSMEEPGSDFVEKQRVARGAEHRSRTPDR